MDRLAEYGASASTCVIIQVGRLDLTKDIVSLRVNPAIGFKKNCDIGQVRGEIHSLDRDNALCEAQFLSPLLKGKPLIVASPHRLATKKLAPNQWRDLLPVELRSPEPHWSDNNLQFALYHAE